MLNPKKRYLQANFELTEDDWKNGLEPELEKQRPKGEPEEQQNNIDWWHFSSYALSLSSLDKQRVDKLITTGDKQETINDFQNRFQEEDEYKWWDAGLYVSRLKELGWHEESFSDNDWQQFQKEVEKHRNKNEWWHLTYYVERLSIIDQKRAKELITDDDWNQMQQAIDNTRQLPNNADTALLTLQLENNLYQIDNEKGKPFIEQNDINSSMQRIQQLKNDKNWWMVAQHMEAITKANEAYNKK